MFKFTLTTADNPTTVNPRTFATLDEAKQQVASDTGFTDIPWEPDWSGGLICSRDGLTIHIQKLPD